jgi:gamma-glutamyltranspeptidase/glutathione hydrolase
MPVLVVRDGALVGVHGTMGGKAQAQIHAQLLLRLDAGLTPIEAISAPRVVVGGGGEGSPDDLVDHEPGVPTAPLEAAGFPLRALPALSEDTGHAQLIRVAPDGSFQVASDPRADGAAIAG